MQQLLLPQNAREAVAEIRPDSTIMSVLSPGAYSFQPEERVPGASVDRMAPSTHS